MTNRLDDLIAQHKDTAPVAKVTPRTNSNHVDMNGVTIKLDDIVIRAIKHGNSSALERCTVTSIKNGDVYLNHAIQPIRTPNRIMVVTTMYQNGPLGPPTVR